MNYKTSGEVCQLLKITPTTLQRWKNQGIIQYQKITSKKYLYDIDSVIKTYSDIEKRQNVIYSRVSNSKQKNDLIKQTEIIKQFMISNGISPDLIFEEIASGMNENRSQFNKLLQLVFQNKIDKIFITFKDRLTRFGFEYFNKIFKDFGTEIVIINKNEEIKIRKNLKTKLFQLQELSENNQLAVTIKLDHQCIYISYEDILEKSEFKTSGNYIGIDLNPNYISCSLFDKDNKLLQSWSWKFAKCIDSHNYNKISFESIEIAKKIINLCKHNQVSFIFIEDLGFKHGGLGRGKKVNRLCINSWPRSQFISNLKKRAKYSKISLFQINPAYTSQIGNIQNKFPDPISASMEIARRGYSLIIQKNKQFYPVFNIDTLSSQWKDLAVEYKCLDWKDLFYLIKNLKLKYRVPWSNDYVFRKFITRRSKISYNCYSYS